MAAFNQMVGELQAALAQVSAMGAATTATQTVAPVAPAPQQPPQPPAVGQAPAAGAGGENQVDQAKSACPAEGAGTQGGQPAGIKQAGTGTTCSPAKAAAKAAPTAARKKPSEEYNVAALLEQSFEYHGGEQKETNDGTPQGPNTFKRSRKDQEDEDAMTDDDADFAN